VYCTAQRAPLLIYEGSIICPASDILQEARKKLSKATHRRVIMMDGKKEEYSDLTVVSGSSFGVRIGPTGRINFAQTAHNNYYTEKMQARIQVLWSVVS